MDALPYAEDVNYWKTGRSAPDVWLDRAKREIEKAGGRALGEGEGPGYGYAKDWPEPWRKESQTGNAG